MATKEARAIIIIVFVTDLLGLMIKRMFLDGAYVESSLFSSLSNKIVVSIGFDKSDSDFIGTWRVCNRRKGNSSVFVQSFACLEGPVAENYENEIKQSAMTNIL